MPYFRRAFNLLRCYLPSGVTRMCSTISGAVIQTVEGTLQGRIAVSVRDVKYYSFQGIPYAQPPTGSLRFQPPVPLSPWTGTRNALKEGPVSHGVAFNDTLNCSEDCLYLNVYTKQIPCTKNEQKLPVMVYIHGGGFSWGSGNTDFYSPDYLIEKNVVVVTINYRLSTLGFLSLQNEACPGNNGLRDQIEALKWVQRNISAFGGDKDNVTVFGESAGGVSVQYLMLSPASSGLFHKAIAQSGSVVNPWGHIRRPVELAFALGAKLGFHSTDKNALFEFLKTVPAKDLMKTGGLCRQVEPDVYYLGPAFGPCIEPDHPGAILCRRPVDLLREGKLPDIPYMCGVVTGEGLVFLKPGSDITEPTTKEEWERLLPVHPAIKKGSPLSDSVLERLRNHYFPNGFTQEGFVKWLSWSYITAGVDQTTQLIASIPGRKSKTYLYHFTFEGNTSVFKSLLGLPDMKGSFHGDELLYLFYVSMLKPKVDSGSREEEMIESLTSMWTDFAKYGEPTPQTRIWAPYSTKNEEYLDINIPIKLLKKFGEPDSKFWSELINDLSNVVPSKM